MKCRGSDWIAVPRSVAQHLHRPLTRFSEKPQPHQALGSGHDRLLVGARNPADIRLAFSPLAFLSFPSSGRICRTDGSRRAASRTRKLGSCQVGTRRAAAPRRRFKIFAMSRIERKSPATARNRSPLAAGWVMARARPMPSTSRRAARQGPGDRSSSSRRRAPSAMGGRTRSPRTTRSARRASRRRRARPGAREGRRRAPG
jgi:hypothetical protein